MGRAIENGANAIAEGFLFSVAAVLILGETYRSSRNQARRRDLDEVVRGERRAERRQQRRAQLQHRGRGLAAQDEVAQVCEDRRVGFLAGVSTQGGAGARRGAPR